MSTTYEAAPHLDLRAERGIPFGRLLGVELRKLTDTRSGRWLLIAMLAVAVLILGGMAFFLDGERGFGMFYTMASQPLQTLLPVLGILTMTAEWSQRTALTTFSLEPRRGRVLVAKMVAALVLSALVLALVLVLSAVAFAASGAIHGDSLSWSVQAGDLAKASAATGVTVLMGLAFGLLLGNSPLAIVSYFFVPVIVQLVGLWEKAQPVLDWVGPAQISVPLMASAPTSEQWAQAGVAALVWIVAPMIVGWIITLRREAK